MLNAPEVIDGAIQGSQVRIVLREPDVFPDLALLGAGPEAAFKAVAPRLEASVTVLPTTAALFTSFKVTVTVDVVEPSAGTETGEADTVELAAVAGSAVKVTPAV